MAQPQHIAPSEIIARTRSVPLPDGPSGDGAAAARRLDATLLTAGFTLSRDLLERLSALEAATVEGIGRATLDAALLLTGGHVQHNSYFISFPDGVPDTIDFWIECLRDALLDEKARGEVLDGLAEGALNLLALPKYGRYQHTYEEMLAAHDDLIAAASDRVTVLSAGGSLGDEAQDLYLCLAESAKPLSPDDLSLLARLAGELTDGEQPETVPMRESLAVIQAARLAQDAPLLDLPSTVTDVLRLACALSGGDASLSEPTRLRSFTRRERRALLTALDRAALSGVDGVRRHAEPLKRLASRLHPGERDDLPFAQLVFAAARGEGQVEPSLESLVEAAFLAGDPARAAGLLSRSPGLLVRSLDHLLRAGASQVEEALESASHQVSARVLLSAREHFANRGTAQARRIFANRKGRAWVAPDARPPLDEAVLGRIEGILDAELASRLPTSLPFVIDPACREAAVATSGKGRSHGLGILPRGSTGAVSEHVRVFVHWRERERRTDYDLSVLLLDEDLHNVGHVSWTSLNFEGLVHSGDITESRNGATELIDIDLASAEAVGARYVVPQVNVFAGEGFEEVAEGFFGYMERAPEQEGAPFEPRTVRAKSALTGDGRVALPLALIRAEDGSWSAKWMHLSLRGHPSFNTVEGNRLSTGMLVEAVARRSYLTLGHIEGLARSRGATVSEWQSGQDFDGPVAFLGTELPEEAPAGSMLWAPDDVTELLGSA
jgi:hypothetical protein